MSDKLLTVFTPAYNRVHTLPRTYKSLKNQTCKDFVWLIVDDGSSDNTAQLVKEWQNIDNGFEIEYIYKENGGMHTAHNTAYENIKTELNVCVDSDDAMPSDAVEKILNTWLKVKDKGYAGIIGLDSDFDGNLIGKGFPENLTETTLSGYYSAGGKGDKKLIYRTDVMNKYPPYPVFEGEKYVSLSYKYLLCDQEYKLFVLNEVLCLVEYQQDGSSLNMWKQYRRNPKGFAFLRKIDMLYPVNKKKIIVAAVHYVSSSLIAKNHNFIKESPKKIITILSIPLGWLLSKYTLYRVNKVEKNND